MKTVKMLSTAFTIMLATLSLTATAASAHTWLVGGSEVTSRTADESLALNMLFENVDEGYAMACSYATKGYVNAEGKGEITSIKGETGSNVISCSLDQSSLECKSMVSVEAKNLPWHTELATVSGELRNTITIGSSAAWIVKCHEAGGGLRENVCSAASSADITNAIGGVEETYHESPKTKCLVDGGNALSTSGTELLRTLTGNLSAK
ncbi:MAG TPA: hypothetical protein VGL57_10470 [Solirubrobacteraceae bacterium]|jgi:hypothetical protein